MQATFDGFNPHSFLRIFIAVNEGYLIFRYALLDDFLIRADEIATIACFSVLRGHLFAMVNTSSIGAG
jgi:hypothetical protein